MKKIHSTGQTYEELQAEIVGALTFDEDVLVSAEAVIEAAPGIEGNREAKMARIAEMKRLHHLSAEFKTVENSGGWLFANRHKGEKEE